MAKRQQLVSQYLENVPRAVLEEIQHVVREYVRGRNGVYALYRRKRLYYVGLARNLRTRLKAHLRDKHSASWDAFSIYLTIGDSHLNDLESLMLRVFRPEGNSQKGKLHRSENLRSRFRRDLKAHYGALIASMLGEHPAASTRRGKRQKKHADSGLGRYSQVARPLRARHKGRLFRAQARHDGRIRFNGEMFDSPSGAALAAIGRQEDGWKFWKYQRAPGDWVPLEVLRPR